MSKQAIVKIAGIIRAETRSGYLQDWGEVAHLMTKEQQSDYFEQVAKIILREIRKLGYRLAKETK